MNTKLSFLLPLAVLFFSCQTKPTVAPGDCIQPCETKVTSDKDISAKLAADLNAINASGSVEGKYKNTLERDYSTLNDKNCLLVLGMRAIECYKQQGIIDAPTAQAMAKDALQVWREAMGASGTRARFRGKVNTSELIVINRSPDAAYIKRELAANGLITK